MQAIERCSLVAALLLAVPLMACDTPLEPSSVLPSAVEEPAGPTTADTPEVNTEAEDTQVDVCDEQDPKAQREEQTGEVCKK
jgi:hypothetical protein